jgi:hypothetical protein
MLENLKTKIQENPEQAKKIGLAVGALVGVAAVGTVVYLNRDNLALPWNGEEIHVEIPATE